MSRSVRIGFVPASRTIFDQELAVRVRGAALEAFDRAGVEVVAPDESMTENGLVQTVQEAATVGRLFEDRDVAGVVIGALNFGNEVPAVIAALHGGEDRPVMLFGIGEEGVLKKGESRRDAFCGLISIATALRHREARFAFPRRAVGFPDDEHFDAALREFCYVCRAVDGVRGAVYGQVGPRPADFETCAYDELSMLRKFGIRIVPIPLSTLFALARSVPVETAREVREQMTAPVDCSQLSKPDLERLSCLEAALWQLVEEECLDGLGLQCWTSFQDDYGISPCYVMSRLTDRGIPCACEADMHGTLSMHILSLAGEGQAGLADWNNRHFERPNAFSAWHCGVFPACLGSGGRVLSYHAILARSSGSQEGKYGTVEMEMDEGPVTMARVTEHPRDRWPVLVTEGEVVDLPGEPGGSHGWVEVEDLDLLYSAILRGFPHHAAVARGHLGSTVACASYFLALRPVIPLRLEEGPLEFGPRTRRSQEVSR